MTVGSLLGGITAYKKISDKSVWVTAPADLAAKTITGVTVQGAPVFVTRPPTAPPRHR